MKDRTRLRTSDLYTFKRVVVALISLLPALTGMAAWAGASGVAADSPGAARATAGFRAKTCSAPPCNESDSSDKKPAESSDDKHTPVDRTDAVVSDADDNIKVGADGALEVSKKTSKPYHISKTATENAAIRLPKDQEVDISDDASTLQYIDRKGGSKLLVKTVGNKKQIEVGSGDVEIRSVASGNTIPLLASSGKALGQIATQTAKDAVRVIRSASQIKFNVGEGKVKYLSAAQGAGVTLYRGENVKLDNGAAILKVTLGSADGLQLASGDALARRPEHAAGVYIPYLDGKLARFSDRLSLLDILREGLEELTGSSGGKLSYDAQSGVVSYAMGSRVFRLIPLGEVQVLFREFSATSVSTTASGAFSLASRGIELTLAGAVGYFEDLQQAVRSIDSAGQAILRSSGALELRMNGARYSAQPSAEASLPERPTPLPGFEAGTDGVAQFRDRNGTLQVLYPTFADAEQLATTVSQAIPGAALSPRGNGTYALSAPGFSYTLVPEYALRDTPGSHAVDRWWADGGMIYLRNGDNTMQGLKIR